MTIDGSALFRKKPKEGLVTEEPPKLTILPVRAEPERKKAIPSRTELALAEIDLRTKVATEEFKSRPDALSGFLDFLAQNSGPSKALGMTGQSRLKLTWRDFALQEEARVARAYSDPKFGMIEAGAIPPMSVASCMVEYCAKLDAATREKR
jgi:hypothetical protein